MKKHKRQVQLKGKKKLRNPVKIIEEKPKNQMKNSQRLEEFFHEQKKNMLKSRRTSEMSLRK